MVIVRKYYNLFLSIKLKVYFMKNFLVNLFKDGNDINEKSVIGFASFVVMVIFAVADIVSGYVGKQLIINDFIFNSFLIMTLGAFGISSVDKLTSCVFHV